MTQTHKLVPIEPDLVQVNAGIEATENADHETQVRAVYAAMLASVPEVGEAVMSVQDVINAGKRHVAWTTLPEFVNSLHTQPDRTAQLVKLCKFIESIDFDDDYALPSDIAEIVQKRGQSDIEDRTAELEDKVKRLVEALREAVQREYNSFEPENQSSRYYRWSALLAEMGAKG